MGDATVVQHGGQHAAWAVEVPWLPLLAPPNPKPTPPDIHPSLPTPTTHTEEALADPYFAGLSQPSREPSAQPISKLAFEFERRKLVVEEVRDGCRFGQLLVLSGASW